MAANLGVSLSLILPLFCHGGDPRILIHGTALPSPFLSHLPKYPARACKEAHNRVKVAFFSYTQSVGVHFGVTSLTVLLWHVAICLVDITIQLISDVLFLPITTGGLIQTAQNMIVVLNWLHFPFIMAFAAFLTVFFYLSVPFVAGAVMKGLSGTTASLQAGVRSTMQATGLAVGTGLTVAGAAAAFGGSAAARAAIEGTRFAADTTSSIGRIANDYLASTEDLSRAVEATWTSRRRHR
jgi:hypothetical protein